LKSSSKLALMAAAGILVGGVGMGTAKAADLGGDCCADLEERVAELEATTVRKGNRKVSLTLTGQIDKEIMYYGDSKRSKTIAGVDNINSSSRFFFTGDAKISSSVKAGFEMMVEWAGATRSDTMNQLGSTTNQYYGGSGVVKGAGTPLIIPTVTEGSGDGALAIRTANWWLEDKVLGRVTVGRVNIQGPASTIDVSGGDLAVAAWSNVYLQGGGFYLQNKNDPFARMSTVTFRSLANFCYGCSREEGIRYDSASIGGLLLGAFWGQQDRFTVQARYAAEIAGFQVAAGAGYQHDNLLGYEDPNLPAPRRNDTEQQGYALSAKHIASGLFLQGQYGQTKFNIVSGAVNPLKTDGKSWHIQGGWAKNAFGPGMTTLYGEYGHGEGYATGLSAGSAAAINNTNFTTIGTSGATITADSYNFYGIGVTQKIDAAAMTLYLGWRHFDPKVSTNVDGALPISSFDTVTGGARILF
jgi:hypothetical protein